MCLCAAVIKMEGGTDFDLQVLEVQVNAAGAGGDASGGGGVGEKSQADPSGGSVGGQTSSEVTVTQTKETASGDAGDNKDTEKVTSSNILSIVPSKLRACALLAPSLRTDKNLT